MRRLDQHRVLLAVVDIQEKFLPVLYEVEKLIRKTSLLISALKILKVPILVTEQTPEKLGKTVEPVRRVLDTLYRPIAKSTFSPLRNAEFRRALVESRRHQILFCGIEAHVCVLQGVLDALAMGLEVFVAQDAVSSRFPDEITMSLSRMNSAGAVVVSAEMAVYELLEGADHPAFRQVQPLVKASAMPLSQGNE